MMILTSFLIGLLFGLGLIVSQMINPAKVIGFLDVAGNWDPSLAFVMGGALVVTGIGYKLLNRRSRPLLVVEFLVPDKTTLDTRLIGGAAIFGIGWGLAGLCPGPALAALGSGAQEAVIFCVAMVAGMAAFRWFDKLLSVPAGLADG